MVIRCRYCATWFDDVRELVAHCGEVDKVFPYIEIPTEFDGGRP